MVGKHIVPWFGGVPAVWMLCLCFYQFALFAGYGYAHLLVRCVQVRRQFFLHAILFLAALFLLPVLPDATWKPVGGTPPGMHILSMLTANVALPFMLLAATGPLLQAWYALTFPGRSPYVLYAVSNAGSLFALLAFPFIVEPHFALSLTSRAWSWAFGICGFAILGCAWLTSRNPSIRAPLSRGDRDFSRDPRTTAADVSLWIALPACAVLIFMGVTNELCVDTASLPFLWIVPLSIYLLTFVLSFGFPRIYRRGFFALLSAIAISSLIWVRLAWYGSLGLSAGALPIPIFAAGYAITLFATNMLLHGELYRSRPPAERLTAYYLCISGGGCLGGLFVGIVAPQIFDEYYELPIGWGACWLLFAIAGMRRPGRLLHRIALRWTFAAAVTLAVGILAVVTIRSTGAAQGELIYQERNFFNILRVIEYRPENPGRHRVVLRSGSTTHGAQLLQPDRRHLPIFYFGAATGIGVAMAQRPDEPMNVGVIGLGVGSLAAYGRSDDRFRFYEIDPNVARIARDAGYFTFLSDSPADIQIVLGDARLSLESELENGGSQGFDLLVLDAFTSDSIPVHLLTVEAFDLYLQHLKPDGVLAVHASSVNFNLVPLILRQGEAHGLAGVSIANQRIPGFFVYRTTWVILSANTGYIDGLPAAVENRRKAIGIRPRKLSLENLEPDLVSTAPLWTDDYSDLISALKKPYFRKPY
jgi:spermidine synthase